MDRFLTAAAFCLFTQAASANVNTSAECMVALPHTLAATQHPVVSSPAGPPLSSSAGVAVSATRPGGELIRTAAAGTRDVGPVGTREVGPHPEAAADHEPPRRASAAMLLAAVALMSAIALRRLGSPDQ